MIEFIKYCGLVVLGSLWFFTMWLILALATKAVLLQGLNEGLNFYFQRRMRWLKEMDKEFGEQEKVRSSFN